MTRNLVICLLLAGLQPLAAQELAPPPRSDVPPQVPVLEISYTTGIEGARWQEYVRLELDEWTPDKDVLITAKWIPQTGARSPGASAPRSRRQLDPFKDRLRFVPTHRAWVIEYADAVTEGESHLFVNAVGMPRFSREIVSADEVFGFVHIPSYGWYETRKAAKAFYNRSSPVPTQNDAPQPSPSDTQSPPETRSR